MQHTKQWITYDHRFYCFTTFSSILRTYCFAKLLVQNSICFNFTICVAKYGTNNHFGFFGRSSIVNERKYCASLTSSSSNNFSSCYCTKLFIKWLEKKHKFSFGTIIFVSNKHCLFASNNVFFSSDIIFSVSLKVLS